MPELGAIKKGFDAGKNYKKAVVWDACVTCGKERWVILKKGKPASKTPNKNKGGKENADKRVIRT